MREMVFLCIITFCAILLFLIEMGMYRVKRQVQVKVYVHNRAVRLGLYANSESIDSREDCFVSERFLRMHNAGTLDTAHLKSCEYKNLIGFTSEDLYGL